MQENHLSEAVPTELGQLTGLEELHLNSNQLSGLIPAQLGNLSDLEEPYLFDNQLTGLVLSQAGNRGIEAMEFGPGVLGGEAPVDDRLGLVAFLFQSMYLPAETVLFRAPLPEAAAGYDAELDLCHIQPTAMLGRMVKSQLPGDAPGLLRRERLVQRRLAMGVQIVQDHPDHFGLGVGLLRQPAHLMGEVHLGAPLRYLHMAPARGSQVRNRLRVPPLTYS